MFSKLIIVGAFLLGVPLLLSAAEQTFAVSTDTIDYSIEYNDESLAPDLMKEIMLLSPYYPSDVPSEYFMATGSLVSRNKTVVTKWIMSVPLEQCNPGYTECSEPKLDERFFENAKLNLQKTRIEIQHLQSLQIPRILEPVRLYLVQHLEKMLAVEQVRFEYLKTGDIGKLRILECHVCSCAGRPADTQPITVADRLDWSRTTWFNSVLSCIRRSDPGYPVAVWRNFLQEFAIKEAHVPKSPS